MEDGAEDKIGVKDWRARDEAAACLGGQEGWERAGQLQQGCEPVLRPLGRSAFVVLGVAASHYWIILPLSCGTHHTEGLGCGLGVLAWSKAGGFGNSDLLMRLRGRLISTGLRKSMGVLTMGLRRLKDSGLCTLGITS